MVYLTVKIIIYDVTENAKILATTSTTQTAAF